MKLKDIIKELDLEVKTRDQNPEAEVKGAYASDLLSDVMAHSIEGCLWLTLQIHPNIVAVASMRDMAGIILVNGREPEAETIKRSNEENVTIMVSKLSTFDLAGKLYKMGVRDGKK